MIVLLTIILISACYSSATSQDIFTSLKKASRLLLLPLLMVAFKEKQWQTRGIWAVILGTLVLLTISLLNKYWYHFEYFNIKDRILSSLFLAFGIFLMALKSLEIKRWTPVKTFLTISIIISTWYLFCVNDGRTGQLIFVLLFIILLFRNFDKKFLFKLPFMLCSIFLIISVLVISIYSYKHGNVELGSQEYKELPRKTPGYERILDALLFTHDYILNWSKDWKHPPIVVAKADSSSIRLEFYIRTIMLCLYRPLFGYGTASFPMFYNSYFPEQSLRGLPVKNPHNQFLLFLFELGLPGLIAFSLILFITARYFFMFQYKIEALVMLGLFYIILIGNSLNSWFLDFSSCHFIICMLALFTAYPLYQGDNQSQKMLS